MVGRIHLDTFNAPASRLDRSLFEQAVTRLRLRSDSLGWYAAFSDSGEGFVRSFFPDSCLIGKLVRGRTERVVAITRRIASLEPECDFWPTE